ncbi:MAG: prepilin-type N-terminal cleavage/methylation domain-containing protein [Nitrospirae bacterium]|nr:prepilin-type N-terminal cleavage/methylation domain-containing protein [Nitrospirota bacterium]
MKKALNNKDGFTLVESMMSLVVLMVGILAVIQLFTLSISGRRNGKDLSIANNLAKRLMEDMKNVGVDTAINNMNNPAVTYPQEVEDGDGVKRYVFFAGTAPAANIREQKVATANKVFTVRVESLDDQPDTNLTTVIVTVTWVGLDRTASTGSTKTHSVRYVTIYYT